MFSPSGLLACISRDEFTRAALALGFGKSNDVKERNKYYQVRNLHNMVTTRRSSNALSRNKSPTRCIQETCALMTSLDPSLLSFF